MLTKRKDGRYVKKVTINKKQVYFYSSEPTERKAEKDIHNQMIDYKEKEEKGKLFKEVAEEWETEHEKKVEYTTMARYHMTLKYCHDEFDNVYLKEISPIDIDRFIKDFSKKGYSQKSVKMLLSILSMIFKYAYIQQYISSNPCMYISTPANLPKGHRNAISNDEIKIVQKNINATFGLFAYLLLYTGLRRGEALALKYEDINFKEKTINVYKSVYYKSNTPYIKTPKTEAGKRTVVLLDCLSEKLPKRKKGYIFSNDDGSLLGNSKVTRLWEKYKKETGLNITPHLLRHTYATLLYDAGISDKDAQDLMGHADITTTKNIYTHISKQRKTFTANKLNEYIEKI